MAKRTPTTRPDIYQEVTDEIVAMLEAGTRPWAQPWQTSGASLSMPLRHNGISYRGINVLILWASAMTRGFSSPHWLTFKQAIALGGMVEKGSKGTGIVYANSIKIEADEGSDKDERRIPFLKRYTVFNSDQIEGLDGKYPKPEPILANPDTRDAELEALFAKVAVTIQHGGPSAYYMPGPDMIQMPEFEAFVSGEEYYATLAHEQVHMSGHSSRLARPTLLSPKKEDRAREELVAELGAAFIGGTIGFKIESREDHAAYLQSWLSALKNDKKALFTAAREAQSAADYLLDAMQIASPVANQEAGA